MTKILRLHTAQSKPDLWETLKSPTHPLSAAWPTFLDQDKYFQHYCEKLDKIEAFAAMQYAIVEVDAYGKENIIACGRSVPFYWPELDQIGGKKGLRQHPEVLHTLPDEGYDAILSRAFEQQLAREGTVQDMGVVMPLPDPARTRTEPPNALSAISITVSPKYRSQGLADILIMAMKQTAIELDYDAMVVPLRPTRKSDFPTIRMRDYLSWPAKVAPGCAIYQKENRPNPNLPFDPWLRKHIRLGARVIKVAPKSMLVEGSVEEWQQWTGVKFSQLIGNTDTPLKKESGSGKMYLEAVFPNGLVPLRYYVDEQCCVYQEPNIWLYHELPLGSLCAEAIL
ncbi:hypothetical protein N7481_012520 [Penicillium waksmanii]|uniref:uncharacterized protein n=1 Tax=Penicillium waksmanii TaxID=69791 RepID=UPI00254940BA|nr:uncharacterized protein N7481_012520 [Penicillium waksmanii]KAJ5965806.1 hypothetical protein N7481_012520 [Penicillium waksmanii]